jgi:hypothetical protein
VARLKVKETSDWLPWAVSAVCLVASFAAPSFAGAIWTAGIVVLLPFLFFDLRKPVNYESLSFDATGFRYSAYKDSIEELRWQDVTDVFYRRWTNDFAGHIETEWEFHRCEGGPLVVLVEWPQKTPFSRAISRHAPGVSPELVAAARRQRGEGRWRCMQSS